NALRGGETRQSVRAVKAAGLAFIAAERRALTEQAGGWRRLCAGRAFPKGFGRAGGNRDRGSSHLLAPPTPPYRRVRIRRFSKLSPCGPEVRVVVRHKGFAALQVSVSASPSSEPVRLSRG